MAKFGFKFESEFVNKDGSGNARSVRPLFGGDTDSAIHLGATEQVWDAGALTFLSANTSGLRANADNVPELIRKQFLPNGAQGQNPSGGWTCTGLFKLTNGNWLVGNDGRVDEADTTFEPSIVELSFDGQTIANEFNMGTIVGNNSVQGVIEANDGSYWIASPNNTIHNINSSTGAEISNFAATDANGLAYDPVNNNLLWCDSSSATVHIYSIGTATELSTIDIVSNPDHLCFNNGALFVTTGANGSEGSVYIYDVVNDKFIGRVEDLPACEAIEGIHVDNNSITIANDGGFHVAAYPPRNMLLTYKFNNVYPAKTKFIGIHGKLTLNGAAPATRETFLAQGKPVTTATPAYGWALFIMNSNELRIQIRDNLVPADLYLAEYAITRGAEFTFDIYVDVTGGTVYCEIDGVDQGVPASTAGAIANIVADMNMSFTTIGVSQEANPNEYPLNASVKNVFTTTTLTDFNAVKAINQGDDNVVSDASITATSAPDGQYNTILFDEYGNELFNSDVEYTTGAATAYGVISAPTNTTGFVVDNEAVKVDGAVITGATV